MGIPLWYRAVQSIAFDGCGDWWSDKMWRIPNGGSDWNIERRFLKDGKCMLQGSSARDTLG